MPKAMQGMPKATFQALSLLNFVFIKDLNDLHKYILVLPNSAYAPDLLILDDSLEAFIDNQLKVDTLYHATLYVKSKIRKVSMFNFLQVFTSFLRVSDSYRLCTVTFFCFLI